MDLSCFNTDTYAHTPHTTKADKLTHPGGGRDGLDVVSVRNGGPDGLLLLQQPEERRPRPVDCAGVTLLRLNDDGLVGLPGEVTRNVFFLSCTIIKSPY